MTAYSLTALSGRYAVCLFPPTLSIPLWARSGDFISITRTHDELSIICDQSALPIELAEAISVARDWVALRVEGLFSFEMTGVLAALSTVLADEGIVILAIATYQTDYLLVKDEQVENAIAALRGAGHRVETET